MFQKLVCFLLLFSFSVITAQEKDALLATKKVVYRDTIKIDSVSINSSEFKLLDKQNQKIDSTLYDVDFAKSQIVFKQKLISADTLIIHYKKYPEFITKEYTLYDKSRIVAQLPKGALYQMETAPVKKESPFEGLTTSGSISRGINIGNNQNTSFNSNLDLQITGKLSENVKIRASLQDNNIPLQNGGYSQKLDEFDQIFIELFSDKWSVRAGDLFLENRKSKLLNFNKKVQGLLAYVNLGKPENKTEIFASGAIVRGQYAKSTFTGQEGNQGPYKLKGNNGELYVLVISGSERVYVNGLLLKRGENNDYVIDYNAGEITFTTLFPINSEMRIVVEYQFSDRNYNRFVTYAGANHEDEKWSLAGYVYSENDVKSQSVQQNLSTEQALQLSGAGDNTSLMQTTSAVLEAYSDNKILYKKVLIGSVEVFEYSNVPTDILYNVKFSLVGANKGNYILKNTITNGRIYEYIAPILGVPQGNYEPKIQLIPPVKTQIATVLGKYNPSEKTSIDFEFGISNHDKNLFSSIDDQNNQGLAGKLNFKQRLFTSKWIWEGFGNFQLIQQTYQPIERLFNIEFNRDWNLNTALGNQSLFSVGITTSKENTSFWKYQFEQLEFSKNFNGNKNTLEGYYKTDKIMVSSFGSFMNSKSEVHDNKFLRNQTRTKYFFKKNWLGASYRLENNQQKELITSNFTNLSQKFSEYGAFIGRGDTTKVHAEIGYLHRANDSVQSGLLKRVNKSDSYYLKSKLIQNDLTDLALFVNYRLLKFENSRPDEPSLNSRLTYGDQFFKQFVQWNTIYETTSGTIPQQEFNFLEVEPGKGVYAWFDYNGNGVQEIQEFEIATFPDQAKYVKIFLPSQIYLKTNQNKFSQTIVLNPLLWQNKKGFLKLMSKFYNQSSYLVDRKILRSSGGFNLNPFSNQGDDLLGLNTTIRNNLYYNRGKQNHSFTYSFIENKLVSFQSSGEQKAQNVSNQLIYQHLFMKMWLINISGKGFLQSVSSENYQSRNYKIKGYQFLPKIAYVFSRSSNIELFYEWQKKENELFQFENLIQNRLGIATTISTQKKLNLTAEFAYVKNEFVGNSLTPVAFQMMEGLQPGKNNTWRLLLQKNLTQYLDINVNYQGRKSESIKTIHTGSIQLRAFF